MATYTKLQSGTWGARVEGNATAGQSITVTTKAGESKPETIEKILWTGPDRQTGRTVSICALVPSARPASSGTGRRRLPRGSGAGATSGPRGYSNYCTDNADCQCYDCAS